MATVDRGTVRARDVLAFWLREQIGTGPLDVRELKRLAKDKFGRNRRFMKQLLDDAIDDSLPDLLRHEVHVGRRASAGDVAQLLDRWYISLGGGTYVRLGESTRPLLKADCDARRARVAGELRSIQFEGALIQELPDDRTTVREGVAVDRLAEIWQSVFKKG